MGIQLIKPIQNRRTSGIETHPWQGLIRVMVRDESTGRMRVQVFPNTICNVGKDYLAGMLAGLNSVGITYMALGTSGTAPTAADTKLGVEVFRKAMTKQTQTGGTQNLLTTTYVASYEGNVAIAEIGWFAGPTASGTTDSGILIAHVLYSHTKINTESLQVDRTDQF